MARVWRDVTVEESGLRFHIAALRKALGDGPGGAGYITTAAGLPHANLPTRLARMVGRADDVRMLSAQMNAARFSEDQGGWVHIFRTKPIGLYARDAPRP